MRPVLTETLSHDPTAKLTISEANNENPVRLEVGEFLSFSVYADYNEEKPVYIFTIYFWYL